MGRSAGRGSAAKTRYEAVRAERCMGRMVWPPQRRQVGRRESSVIAASQPNWGGGHRAEQCERTREDLTGLPTEKGEVPETSRHEPEIARSRRRPSAWLARRCQPVRRAGSNKPASAGADQVARTASTLPEGPPAWAVLGQHSAACRRATGCGATLLLSMQR